MAATSSTMLALGTSLPPFDLPDVRTGGRVRSADFDGQDVLVVMFICNHCPFVQHVKEELARLPAHHAGKSVAFVGINSNDVERHPEEAPEKMKEMADRQKWAFPYLFDDTQEVAKAFRAACTPDFFVFDRDRRLAYRGQLDDSRPGNEAGVSGKDLRLAVDALLAGGEVPTEQRPSIGCNIKWKPGNEPDYFRS